MATENKTEQATPQRRLKARQKGQVVRSRELSSALALLTVVFVIAKQADSPLLRWRGFWSSTLRLAASGDLNLSSSALQLTMVHTFLWIAPPLMAAFAVCVISSFAQGGFVFAGAAFSSGWDRLNPVTKLSQLCSVTNLASLLKSLIPASFIVLLAYQTLQRDWLPNVSSVSASVPTLMSALLQHCYEIVWKSALVLLIWAGVDYALLRNKHERDLRMMKQEVREEAKESDGNPQVKAQIRRLQRQTRRRRMLKDAENATVIIANPTHFAIALQYTPDMPAPVVLAKGRDLLAQKIKEIGYWHGIPVVENPPLAQALYKTVEIGNAIPANLYVAVAEILAFVYRTQQQVGKRRGTH